MKHSWNTIDTLTLGKTPRTLREGLKKKRIISWHWSKEWVGILQKSLLLEALEIVTCHKGGWVSKEDVTISKQTFRVVLYPSQKTPLKSDKGFWDWHLVRVKEGKASGKKCRNIFEIQLLRYLFEIHFFQEYVIISPRWVGGKLSNT